MKLQQPDPHGTTTYPAMVDVAQVRRATWMRRAGLGVLVLFLAGGAAGLYGVRHDTVIDEAGPHRLEVGYPSMSRPGLDSPWRVQVRREGGFGADAITLRTSAAYFDAFDENGLDPQPDSATSDGTWTTWTFDAPPDADTFEVSFDARLSPATQRGVDGRTQLLVDDEVVADVRYRTGVMP